SIDLSGLFGENGTFNLSSIDLSGLFGENGTFNLSSIDLSGLFGGNGTSFNISSLNISSIIDSIFGKTEVKDSINSTNLVTYYDKTIKFNVTVMSGDKPVTEGNVVFTINNKEYAADIGSDGVAVLKLQKLKPGTYYVTSAYKDVLVQNKIVVKKSILAKDVTKKYKKAGKFIVKVLDTKGKPQAKQTVKMTLKGKTYTAKTNSKGIATFNLPKNLKVGKYTIKTYCKGLTISNKLTVKK
ncbi:Ig-like domain-containing protein, partial [Methanobrevibacter sp.]|uniref:Ig-like domain-containing protein n=1 Tax=Methanobrevibacter sp. TaxID=66852 RepID=UPI0025FE7928